MGRRIVELPAIHRRFAATFVPVRAAGETEMDPLELIGKGRLYDVVLSSEEAATQWYWELGYINETLSHKKDAVLLDRLESAGPWLWMHDRYDQVGCIHEPMVDVDAKVIRAKVEFSRTQRGRDFELDAVTGIKRNVSIGYVPHEMLLTRRGDRDKGELDDYMITLWEPHEGSMVSIPADYSKAGFGKSAAEELALREGAGARYPVVIEDGHPVEEVTRMKTKEQIEAEAAAKAAAEAEAAAPTRTATVPAPAPASVEVGSTNRDKEVAEMIGMARNNGCLDQFDSALERGLTPAQFAHEIVQKRTIPVVTQPPAERSNAVPDEALKKYSLRRAILMTIPRSEGGIDPTGLEWDVHQEIERNLPMGVRRPEGERGILVPTNMPGPDPRAAARAAKTLGRPDRRDEYGRAYPLDSATSTEGTEFKFTSAGPFIDMLRAQLITARLGARFLPGLPGPIGFPRKTASSTPTWQSAEAVAVTDSMPLFELMTLTPKTLIDTTGTTRQLLRMASEDFEALLRQDIIDSHAVAIDTAAFVGSGASGQPSGLYVLAGITSHDVGPGAGANAAPDYIDITTMIGLLGDAGIAAMGAFAMTPLLAATLMRTLTFPAANTGEAIWKGPAYDGLCAGYRAVSSNVLSKTLNNGVPGGGSEHGIVHGDFPELFIGEFGAFEIIADPYSSKKSGVIELTSFQMIDVNVRHQASFVKGINAIP